MDYAPLDDALTCAAKRFVKGDSFRVFHGRGRCYPGLEFLAIDFFQPVLLVTIYRSPPSGFVDELANLLKPYLNTGDVRAVLVQYRDRKEYGLQLLLGEAPEEFLARRGDLRFQLSDRQQNIGYFLDIEPARSWLEREARGGRVLNLFAFTCSFSVVAMAAGAESVLNMDMNRNALNTGRRNHGLNEISTEAVEFFAHDILRSWGKLIRKGPYDIVIVDPPSMQRASFVATKDYAKIIRKLPELLHQDSLALLCLNAPEISQREFEQIVEVCDQPLVLEQSLPANPDFPDKNAASLKMLVYRLEAGLALPPL